MILNIYGQAVAVKELPTTMDGLKFLPQMEGFDNDADWEKFTVDHKRENIPTNLELYTKIVKEHVMQLKGAIVEVGVAGLHRPVEGSFTECFIKNKPKEMKYVGIDCEDRVSYNKLLVPENNAYAIIAWSKELGRIRAYLKELGIEKIALLHIDGYHSVNAVIDEWSLTDMLEDKGVVLFHDTNSHPGPAVFIHAIDPSKYRVERYFTDIPDWGAAAAFKL